MSNRKRKNNRIQNPKKIQNRGEGPRRQVNNALVCGLDGSLGAGDASAYQAYARTLTNNRFNWSEYVNIYYAEPLAKKAVDIPVEDMLKNRWTYASLDEDKALKMRGLEDQLGLYESISECLKQERVLGGCALLMGVSDGKKMSEPLVVEDIPRGGLKFCNVISRNYISSFTYGLQPTSPYFGRPEYYNISGETVHRSRLLLFDGQPLFKSHNALMGSVNLFRNDGMGVSIIGRLMQNIIRVTGSQQAAYNLLHKAGAVIVTADIQSLEEMGTGMDPNSVNPKLSELMSLAQSLNAYQAAILQNGADSGSTTVDTLNPSFGSVPELMINFIQILAACVDIPATRFLGQSPGGLNATGESDLENYYNAIESQRELVLTPTLRPIFNVMQQSLFGCFEPLDIEFDPLWSMSSIEKAQVRQMDTTTILSMLDRELLTPEQAFHELKSKEVFSSEYVKETGYQNAGAYFDRLTDGLITPEEDEQSLRRVGDASSSFDD